MDFGYDVGLTFPVAEQCRPVYARMEFVMIGRARRAFPGMVVSMMLAYPALAAHAAIPSTPTDTILRKAVTSHRHGSSGRGGVVHAAARPGRPHGQATARRNVAPTQHVAEAGPVWNDGATHVSWHQTGIASWYGGRHWQGQHTSSGSRYDENELTAAHATLPIGTRVRVTLEGSQRSVIVIINDRPGTHRRIIDLSRGAAAELGILSRGVAVVTLTVL